MLRSVGKKPCIDQQQEAVIIYQHERMPSIVSKMCNVGIPQLLPTLAQNLNMDLRFICQRMNEWRSQSVVTLIIAGHVNRLSVTSKTGQSMEAPLHG